MGYFLIALFEFKLLENSNEINPYKYVIIQLPHTLTKLCDQLSSKVSMKLFTGRGITNIRGKFLIDLIQLAIANKDIRIGGMD
ncbi:hypothetical protein DYD21_08900 [Rhodohalobacter sp. SW132]|nr:hypothetical protein DYD21_08900 [Rhodohalobacter sp. SW132]